MYLENWIKYQIVYKQVNNENEIEINHKSVFSKFCGFWERSQNTISLINRENQKIFTTSKTVVKNPTHNAGVGIWKEFVLKRMRQWRLRRILRDSQGARGSAEDAYLGM